MTRPHPGWPGLGRCVWLAMPTSDHDCGVWWKFGAPEGTQVVGLFEIDGKAHVSPDGNWNIDPQPIHPPCTFDEAVSYLNRLGVAPSLTYHPEIPAFSFALWPASGSNVFAAWEEGDRRE